MFACTAGTAGVLDLQPPQKFGHGSFFAGHMLFRKQVPQKYHGEPPPPHGIIWGYVLEKT